MISQDARATNLSRYDEVVLYPTFGHLVEDDLGLDSSLQAGIFSFHWRLAQNHRIRWTFTPINRSSTITAKRDLPIGDNTITAGSRVDTSVRSNVYDFDYLYSFYKTPKWEHAASQ